MSLFAVWEGDPGQSEQLVPSVSSVLPVQSAQFQVACTHALPNRQTLTPLAMRHLLFDEANGGRDAIFRCQLGLDRRSTVPQGGVLRELVESTR